MPDPYVMNGAISDGLWDVFGVIALVFCLAFIVDGIRKR